MERITGALKGLVNWVAVKFVEDDERWNSITQSVESELISLIGDLVPEVIDRIRNAISLALTGKQLFIFESDSETGTTTTDGSNDV